MCHTMYFSDHIFTIKLSFSNKHLVALNSKLLCMIKYASASVSVIREYLFIIHIKNDKLRNSSFHNFIPNCNSFFNAVTNSSAGNGFRADINQFEINAFNSTSV